MGLKLVLKEEGLGRGGRPDWKVLHGQVLLRELTSKSAQSAGDAFAMDFL